MGQGEGQLLFQEIRYTTSSLTLPSGMSQVRIIKARARHLSSAFVNAVTPSAESTLLKLCTVRLLIKFITSSACAT